MIQAITGNNRKFEELLEIIPELQQLKLELPEIQSLDPHEVVRAKIEAARLQHQGSFIVEDSSLAFDGLNGLPGPFIKWFEQTLGISGLEQLAAQIGNRRATASTIIGYADETGTVEYFEGSLTGTIVSPRGQNDFGYGPLFQPDGQAKTLGEMNRAEKQALSPRAQAARKFNQFLEADIRRGSHGDPAN